MLLKDLYRSVILTEETAVTFLRENNLLDTAQKADPCHRCGAVMKEKRRRDRGGEFRPVLRCPVRGCQTSRSVRRGNQFFHYTDMNKRLNCKLKLSEILELVYFFVMDISMTTAATLTGKSQSTVSDWYNMCREVCGSIVSHRLEGKMVGTNDNPILIYDARLSGRRKAGRKLDGDNVLFYEDSDAEQRNNKNYGRKIDGPWVFGLEQGSDCRFFYVNQRDSDTLIPIVERECERGSVIHSDEYSAYNYLNDIGYNCVTVNYQGHDEDPATRTRTQAIERLWLESKTTEFFQLRLDHYCWKVLRKDSDDLFVAFLNDVGCVYRTDEPPTPGCTSLTPTEVKEEALLPGHSGNPS